MNSTKLSGYRTGIKFNNSVLVVEQNNYASKIVNVYIVCDEDTWPKNPLNNFTLKKCLFGTANIAKNNVKEKFKYSGYGIVFDGAAEWVFNNDYDRNVIIFCVENVSSSHTDNRENDFLVLVEGPTFSINGNFGSPEKSLVLILVKQRQCFVWVYIIVVMIVIYLQMEKKSIMLTFQLIFLGSISNKLGANDSIEVSLKGKGNVYDFSVDFNSFDKCNILNIHKCLMIKNSI